MDDASKPQNRSLLWSLFRGVIPLLLLATLIYILVVYLGEERILTAIKNAGVWTPLVFILLKIVSIIIAPLSGTPYYLLAKPLFGLVEGFVYLMIADILGYSAAFGISRVWGRKLVMRLLGSQTEQVDFLIDKIGKWKEFLYFRIVFFYFAELPSYVAGLTQLPYWQFLAITIPIAAINIGVFLIVGNFITNKLILSIMLVLFLVIFLTRLIMWSFHRE